MNSAISVQILDEAACVSFCTHALGKGMNSSPSEQQVNYRVDWVLLSRWSR